jgi:hypothetical protein
VRLKKQPQLREFFEILRGNRGDLEASLPSAITKPSAVSRLKISRSVLTLTP